MMRAGEAGKKAGHHAGQVPRSACSAGAAPAAMLFNIMTTKAALGCVVTRVPSMTDFDQDPLEVIETGDWVKVDADNGIVEVTKKADVKPASAAE